MSARLGHDAVRVLYILGWGRSGSTILGNILGEVPGLAHVGELRAVWDAALRVEQCGCGAPVDKCRVWRSVLDKAAGQADSGPSDWERAIALRDRVDRTRNVRRLAALRTGRRDSQEGEHLAVLSRLYQATRRALGCDVIVDSSKMPSHALLLDALPDVELSVVHLVRDPRATAYSWCSAKARDEQNPDRLMPRYSPLKSATHWLVWNLLAERIWRGSVRYVRLSYEGFAEDPQGAVRAALDVIGLGTRSISPPFVGDHDVQLGPNHTVDGNPVRFGDRRVTVRIDDRWRSEMRARDRWIVDALTWPLLRRYGYVSAPPHQALGGKR